MTESQFDFSHLDIEGRTREFKLPFTSGAVLIVKPANDANPVYWQSLIEDIASRGAIEEDDAEKLKQLEREERANERERFAKTVVVGWKDVVNKRGEPVEFSEAACIELLKSLPDWLFERLHQFCRLVTSFVVEPKTLAGN